MMGFKIKTFRQILDGMAEWVTSHSDRLTNFHVGSVVRTFLEGVAVELESLYFEMYKGFKYAIENAIFNSLEFEKTPATHASGNITLKFKGSLQQDITLPQGFQFSTVPTDGDIVYFRTTQPIIIKAGVSEVEVFVVCTEPGPLGNISANSIRLVTSSLPFIDEVYNENAFLNGYQEESTEERKKRFTEYIETLSKGTKAAIRYGCVSVPGVAGAYVEERLGLVKVYIHDVNGNSPIELRELVLKNLINYRAAGVEIEMLPIVKKPVSIIITAQLASNLNQSQMDYYRDFLRNATVTYLDSFAVSDNLIKADLIRHLMTVAGSVVINIKTDLEEDIISNSRELIGSGDIKVTVHK